MWFRHLIMSCSAVACLALVSYQWSGHGLVLEETNGRALEIAHGCSDVICRLDTALERDWVENELVATHRADSLQIGRRLCLSLAGTIPSLEEIRAMERVPTDQHVAWWLDRLLWDRRSTDYLAERFARMFVGNEEGPFIVFRRRRFVSWLSDCLLRNEPYDKLVRNLISAEGIGTDSPGVNFITVTNGTNEESQPDPARLASRTTRAFLGVRLDCMQCHDDHLGGQWRQTHFHQLAAFFGGVRSSGLGIHDTGHLYQYRYLDAQSDVTVLPQVPFCHQLAVEPNISPREQLAEWVTHPDNKAFARTAVNRVWGILFGRPLVRPVDNIPLEGPYPPGLEILAEDFVQHGYDLRRLIVTIASSRPFQLQSRADHPIDEYHEDHWAVFPVTRLRPDQAAGAIVQAASLSTLDSESHILLRLAKFGQIDDFVKRYGDLGEDEFDDRGGTIPQRLLMLNGKLVWERSKDDAIANSATRIAIQVADNQDAIEAAYLVVLSRRPSSAERAHFQGRLSDPALDRKKQLEDLFWSLLNSMEFSWNH